VMQLCKDLSLKRIAHSERSLELMMPARQVAEAVAMLHDSLIGVNQ